MTIFTSKNPISQQPGIGDELCVEPFFYPLAGVGTLLREAPHRVVKIMKSLITFAVTTMASDPHRPTP